jgi:hypothetical protein
VNSRARKARNAAALYRAAWERRRERRIRQAFLTGRGFEDLYGLDLGGESYSAYYVSATYDKERKVITIPPQTPRPAHLGPHPQPKASFEGDGTTLRSDFTITGFDEAAPAPDSAWVTPAASWEQPYRNYTPDGETA